MRKAMLRFIGCMAGMLASAYFMPGVTFVDWASVLAAGAALGVVYMLLRPIARLLLAVFNMLTLGVLYILVDTFLVVAVTRMIEGFDVADYWWALGVALAVNLGRALFGRMAK